MRKVHTLVIGSGAAGLAAAVRLHELGMEPVIFTEGLKMGTSINTGSDKQTYYKLGMYGAEPDSPVLMAQDLAAGGAVHGDLALTEAALSVQGFFHLASIGVPFPHDEFGQYIGYKTDHDPKRRATSLGPYTSREMCRALIGEVKKRGIEVREKRVAVSLVTVPENGQKRCCGAIFVNTKASGADAFETVLAENVIFAVGGPGGFYSQSVYPAVHTGAIGLALQIGAKARNLPEFQFGMASTQFRWNVSGSYMQVLPRIISTDADGSGEREFLRDAFPSVSAMYDAIFLKGYQWPFSAGHVPGSSLIDILIDRETVQRGRRVFLDYRTDPADFDFESLSAETKEYLTRSGATGSTPIERLAKLNQPAIDLYAEHKIDLHTQPLEIAVCAQHNNGGLAGDIWWESENIARLFPIGEVNGSHGITRPGGTALNAGQVGAFRASELIAARYADETLNLSEAESAANTVLNELVKNAEIPCRSDWKKERRIFQSRMSAGGAFIRRESELTDTLSATRSQLTRLEAEGFAGKDTRETAEILRNRQLLTAQIVYLEAMRKQVQDGVGSRGGSIVLSADGVPVHPDLPPDFLVQPENPAYRAKTLETTLMPDGSVFSEWKPCRPIPETDGWFETVWREYRTKHIYEKP